MLLCSARTSESSLRIAYCEAVRTVPRSTIVSPFFRITGSVAAAASSLASAVASSSTTSVGFIYASITSPATSLRPAVRLVLAFTSRMQVALTEPSPSSESPALKDVSSFGSTRSCIRRISDTPAASTAQSCVSSKAGSVLAESAAFCSSLSSSPHPSAVRVCSAPAGLRLSASARSAVSASKKSFAPRKYVSTHAVSMR